MSKLTGVDAIAHGIKRSIDDFEMRQIKQSKLGPLSNSMLLHLKLREMTGKHSVPWLVHVADELNDKGANRDGQMIKDTDRQMYRQTETSRQTIRRTHEQPEQPLTQRSVSWPQRASPPHCPLP